MITYVSDNASLIILFCVLETLKEKSYILGSGLNYRRKQKVSSYIKSILLQFFFYMSLTFLNYQVGCMSVFVKTGLDPVICVTEEYLFPFFSTKIFILHKLK